MLVNYICISHCFVQEDINDNNDHDSTSNLDDLDRRNETILLLVPVSGRGLVHTKLSDVSTEQQIITNHQWFDSYNNKIIFGCVHGVADYSRVVRF